MPDINDNDIDALLRHLNGQWIVGTDKGIDEMYNGFASALTALIAERHALREQLRLANIDQCNTEAEANDRDRDLRERLVCAIWPEIMREWREHQDAGEWRGWARHDALEEADKMLAAMRKGDSDGK